MHYRPTAASAGAFAQAGQLEDWVHLFLCGEGANQAFSDGLKLEPRRYHAPRMMRLDMFKRCCGPEADMQFQVPEATFARRVDAIALSYEKGGWDMPPLIVYRDGSQYVLNDGNHRYEALRKLGIEAYWVILWETVR